MKVVLLLASTLFAALTAFSLQLVLSRALIPEDFGKVAFANSTSLILGTFAASGIASLLVRRSSVDPSGYIRHLEAAVGSSIYYVLLASTICVVVLCISGIGPIEGLFVATAIVALSHQAILTGQNQYQGNVKGTAVSQITLPGIRLFMSLGLYFIDRNFFTAVALIGGANLICTVIYRLKINKERARAVIDSSKKEFLVSSFRYSINGVINIAQLQLSIGVLGILNGLAYAGYLSICNTILTSVYILPNTIFNIHLLKKYHVLGNNNRKMQLKLAAFSMLAGLLIAIAVYITCDFFIIRIFGAGYAESAKILEIACWSIPLRFFSTGIGATLLSEELITPKLLVALSGLVVQIGLFFLIKNLGSEDIGLSLVVSELVVALGYISIFMKKI